MVPQPLLMRLLLLAAAASAATAAGNGCSSGCNLALGSFTIARNENLTYIASLFGIDDYQKLKPYNPRLNLDFIPVGGRVNVYFPCRCLALPAAPFSTYLAGSFPYKVLPLDTYSSIAAKFSNLTTADWLVATNIYPSNNTGGRTVTVNVTVNCSCGDPAVSPEYKLFLTYPLGEGETFDSVAEKNGFLLESDMDLFRKYNPANDSRIVYIPLRGVSAIASPTDSPSKGPWKNKAAIMASASSVLGLSIILISLFLWYKKYYGMLPWKRGSRNAPRIESFLKKQGTSHPKRYSYSEVKRMTKSFAHKLGQGGYGAVYRGNLPDGREIAVKMLKDTEGDGEEFMNEVASISRTSHVNIVTLLGYCLQGPKRALLYEYMPNGSLERHTFGSNSTEGEDTLSWDKLFDIVIGIARGLEYLHTACNTRIVHFDIKPQNILLDQDYCPKISDFGLSKLCRQKESKISIAGARGTIGYIAPEVFSRNYGAVGSKADVYSYGMVVLEMVGARKQIDVSTDDSSSKYFPQWLYENLDQFCGATACEISSDNTTELVRKMIIVGLWCIQFVPADRPSMGKVLEMLESNTALLQLPPKAF
ncbi:hypothetical protein GQ55_5G197100 [Panicum hallii var. hallii]|uniref:Protein kinase domain-containing protein n=1 Tax=Panicum hallii var. hallii TaxID=1504633 RepID=A0A2T7DI40_9POAL|nr:hypothetical protein GQ55_5G197100 [Panicum hallii var. hallii]